MQLAASQRPHPPPVPPRPSRQVVAEALKRSPRPPCPTRQAPPPPNTKPWRSDQQQSQQQQQQQQHQQQVCPIGGRTIVYESIKECAKDCGDESVPDDRNHQDHCGQTRDTEDNRPENLAGDRRKLNDGKIVGTSERSLRPAGNVVRKRNSLTEDQRPRKPLEVRRDSRGKDNLPNYHRGRRRDSPGKDQRREDAKESVVEMAVSDLRERTEARISPDIRTNDNVVSHDEEERRASSGRPPDSGGGERAAVSHAEKCDDGPTEREANGRDARSAPTCGSCPGEQPQQETSLASEKATGRSGVEAVSSIERSGSTSLTNVDRATTVLVVDDEPERKITLSDEDSSNDSDNNIHRQDWLEAGVRYSSTQITLLGDDVGDAVDGDRVNGYDDREEERISDLDFISIQERIAMSSLQGLPPLPRSLSGFNLSGGHSESGEPPPPPTRSSSKSQRGGKTSMQSSSRPSPPARQLTTLDTQLAVLKREMFGLRQLDLSLLSQLWSLNESIQEFRQLLQEQEDRAPSPSPSSEEGDDTSYGAHPPPPPRRPAPTLHRPPRPPRPPRPSHSDELPSSEEYGAV